MYFIGIDVGSSSIKASLVKEEDGKCVSSAQSPIQEMPIIALQAGWAEQSPEMWWEHVKICIQEIILRSHIHPKDIRAIGISYQMHGLVLIDKNKNVLRPSIIWCDSRAVEIGKKAFEEIGEKKCMQELLNSPGNFTASKLRWVKEKEPEIYEKIYKIFLPRDYIAWKLTGEIHTTATGLSEGILWDFRNHCLSETILSYYGFERSFIPKIIDVFAEQGNLTEEAAKELGLHTGVKVTYRAGDQPNNAFSLGVLDPGQIAATAGTSGVVYGVVEDKSFQSSLSINSFAHVNHTATVNRIGILLCINGAGILNSWVKKHLAFSGISYEQMNSLADSRLIGSSGLKIFPFGNGAERMFDNKNIGASITDINFNIHTASDILRAAQEGVAFSFRYGIEMMQEMGMNISAIKAGNANMFLSPLFKRTLASITGASVEIYNTDGSVGAARGAGVGLQHYTLNSIDSFLQKIETVEPDIPNKQKYIFAYNDWKKILLEKLHGAL